MQSHCAALAILFQVDFCVDPTNVYATAHLPPHRACHHVCCWCKVKGIRNIGQAGGQGWQGGQGCSTLHKECQVLVRCPRRCDVRRMLNWLPRGGQEVGELTGCPVLWGVQRTEQTHTHARLLSLSLSHTPSLAMPLCVCYKNNERLCWRGWQLCWPIAIAFLCIRIKQFTISDSPLWYFYF